MGDKGQNPAMWQYSQYPPYGQGYQGYGQPGYGYPNQYYGMQQYQQGMGYSYGGGPMGAPGQGQGPPLPPGFNQAAGSKDADVEELKDENSGKLPSNSASPSAPPGEEELIPLPSGTPPPPPSSNGLPPGFSPRQTNFFPNQVPNNPFPQIRFNINHKNRMQYPFNQNSQAGNHQAPRPNVPHNPAALLQQNLIGQPGQPMMGKKKRKRAKQLAMQAAAAAAAAAATNTGRTIYPFVTSMETLTSVPNPNNIPPLPPNPPPPDNPPPLPPLPEEPPVVQPPPPPTVGGATNPAPSAPPAGADAWPESLKNYVKMCYDRCKTGVDKDRVEIILKGKIMRATNENTLWTKNWEEEELPKLSADLLPSPRNFGNLQRNNIAKTVTPNRGINARLSLGNKFNKGQVRRQSRRSSSSPSPSRSRSRSRSRRKSRSRSRSRSRSHSRSHSRSRSRSGSSHSSHRRRKRSSSSSSSEDDFKSLKVGKGRAQRGRVGDRLSFPGKGRGGTVMNKKAKHPKGVLKSHFYSEFGGNTEELGNSEQLQKRAARFSAITRSPSNPTALLTPQNNRHKRISMTKFSEDTEGDFDLTECHVVGTCQEIEKRYLRLTSAPDPSQVRPVEVLKVALNRAKDKWLKSEDYHASCDQLKSIRQDLTVQGIRDQFTVYVYETHARIALEKGDHEEFNQCQTQLKMLYADLGGENVNEFTAYRILYYIFTKNNLDLTVVMASLTPEAEKNDCIAHALSMRSAWWLGNYHKFFKLYRAAPKMAAYLVDWFADRERKAAIKIMIKSYRQHLPVSFVAAELAFASEEKCLEFLTPFGFTFADIERTKIDCKASSAVLTSF
ncbi:Leukocyte receptor cluster member 8-like protein [Frankliniella fusca]|uniref:Leukocyte receptor cluster member 8-like protein n=1 Tax=Frankliniella fusca TaxID=407009 RepID=A0AAE1H5K7_9NEOP|nr:Leukocyte receptor cluster member 8-like protein [Frankliniella fusca]